jgi:hypothetical protein
VLYLGIEVLSLYNTHGRLSTGLKEIPGKMIEIIATSDIMTKYVILWYNMSINRHKGFKKRQGATDASG